MNKIILSGRLTKDPELRYTKNGKAVCIFTLAVPKERNREECDFFKITTWGNLAEACVKYLKKGNKCLVDGTINITTKKENEQYKVFVDVVANQVEFIFEGKEYKNTATDEEILEIGEEAYYDNLEEKEQDIF